MREVTPSSVIGRALMRGGHLVAWLFFVTFLISTYEVIARYGFGAPTAWVHVTSTSLCVVAFAVGGSYAMVRSDHLRVSVFADRFSPAASRAAAALSLLCGAVYLAGLSWGLWREAAQSVLRFDLAGVWIPELTPGPPNWPLPALAKTMLLFGALLFLLAVLDAAIQLARRRAS